MVNNRARPSAVVLLGADRIRIGILIKDCESMLAAIL
jgi:hypothetical protein